MVTTTGQFFLNGSGDSANLQSGQTDIVVNSGSDAAKMTVQNGDTVYASGSLDTTVYGANNNIYFSNTASNDTLTLNAGLNTITGYTGSVSGSSVAYNTFVNVSGGTYNTGAYSTFVNAHDATIITGNKSQFSNSNDLTVTTGTDSVFDVFKNGTLTAGMKTQIHDLENSDATLGRASHIDTANNSHIETVGTDLTVGALKNSYINEAGTDGTGYGGVSVTGSIQGADTITAQDVSVLFGTMDNTATLTVDASRSGSITGGSGTQSVTQTGSAGLTFISAAGNSGGNFSATGGTGADTFIANSSMTMTGGAGAGNTFDIMRTGAGAADVIKDFTAANNTLDLSGFGLTQSSFASILDNSTVSSAGLTLHLDSKTTLTLADVSDKSALTSSNVVLS
ncbi:hypothetical protein KUA11_10810 [Acetobacter estunensis]|nr:hypothetical protein [Acetobacter estunensis]